MSNLSSPLILVTGANGYIAMHTILQLLSQGYKVRGTLRAASNAEQMRATLAKHSKVSNPVEFVCADLMQDSGWAEAVQGCEYILHLASPFPLGEPKDENELIAPAVDGTIRVLRAANAAKVKRVVFLSSMLAVRAGHEVEHRTFDERDWAVLKETVGTYAKSKILAEPAAWDFIHSPENNNYVELTVINASSVFGPFLDSHYATSSELVRTLMRRQVPGVARIKNAVVDVRDLATALVTAMISPQAADQRFCCVGAMCWMQEIATILRQHFVSRGYNIPTRVLPDSWLRLLSLVDPKIRLIVHELGWNYTVSTKRIEAVLGWRARPLKETLVDMAESMVQLDLV
jgi:dihydroflavonol-4-reductase